MSDEYRLYPKGTFPTTQQVEGASHEQLARWMRYLPSADDNDRPTQELIYARFKALGGWNPALSKAVGWDY